MDSLSRSLQKVTLNDSIRNFRQISVYPTATELTCHNTTKLPVNIIKGPYENTKHYLQTHFALLREDFYKPIREDIMTFLEDPSKTLNVIKIHQVIFIRRGVKAGDICHCLELKNKVQMHDKRFMFGSLLIFSKDNFKTIFCGRIVDTRNINHGKILVHFEQFVHLRFDEVYSMIELDIFFEPYYQVLRVLKKTHSSDLAMQRYLIHTKSSVSMPKYLNGIKYTVTDSALNESQLAAINGALSQELAIIQGPPGTGKTFLGLKVAEQLLSLSRKWYDDSPLLVISSTNHALDQFLEGVAKYTTSTLRCGARSQNPNIKNYTIAERRQAFYKTSKGVYYKRKESSLYREYAEIQSKIKVVEDKLDLLKSKNPTSIFNLTLMSSLLPKIKMWFSSLGDIVCWLLEEKDDDAIQRLNMSNFYITCLKPEIKSSNYSILSVSIMERVVKNITEKLTACQREDELTRQTKIRELQKAKIFVSKKLEYFKSCLKQTSQKTDRYSSLSHSSSVPLDARWGLYRHWLSIYATHLTEEMDDLIEKYLPAYNDLSEVQDETNLSIMRHQKVIGMTTTMAARMNLTIKALKSPIVIVEEAAQVLEAHIIPVLTKHCQHLILIGDHKQLRPATADYLIETKHKLGISLFERMMNNDIQCHTLNVQHRMRPEISSLITPSIYTVLHDHKSVTKFPSVNGMKKNVFFISHSNPEENSGKSSKRNLYEAKFLIELAIYLLKNNYKPEDITILAAYLGQVDCLTTEQNINPNEKVKEVQITSIDNFQGEENKIILLSLVRNNPKENVGFLATNNRVCVALSRARQGLYIMGNINHLVNHSKLWKEICESLISQNSVGTSLPLKCQQHSKITMICDPKQFGIECSDGGCTTICNVKMKCDHKCSRPCHNDELHQNSMCNRSCSKLYVEEENMSFFANLRRFKL